MNILKIAFRNLNRQKRRSMLLVIAIAFAFLIVTFIDGFSAGSMKSLSYQIAKMIGGHIQIQGAVKSPDKNEDDKAEEFLDSTELIEKAITEIGIEPQYVTYRSELLAKFIFEGKETNMLILGCNFEDETLLKDSISFKEGSWEAMKKENALLLSEQTVEAMNLKLHDVLLCECKTISGQATVAEFQLEGISAANSILSQASSYVNKAYMNKITQSPVERFQSYGIYLKNANMQEVIAERLEKKLGEYAPVTNRMQARITNKTQPISGLSEQLNRGTWQGTKYMVASMYDAAPQLTAMVSYVQAISLGVLFVLLVITMIGVSNTFRMIVHERKSEIGTMRSCGVTKGSVRRLFIAEAVCLAMLGAVIGMVLAIAIMQIISFFPISGTSAFSAFAVDGYFKWSLSPLAAGLKFILMLILTLVAARSAAAKAANMVPAEALRVGK